LIEQCDEDVQEHWYQESRKISRTDAHDRSIKVEKGDSERRFERFIILKVRRIQKGLRHGLKHLDYDKPAISRRSKTCKRLEESSGNNDKQKKEDGGFFDHFLEDDNQASKEWEPIEMEEQTAVYHEIRR